MCVCGQVSCFAVSLAASAEPLFVASKAPSFIRSNLEPSGHKLASADRTLGLRRKASWAQLRRDERGLAKLIYHARAPLFWCTGDPESGPAHMGAHLGKNTREQTDKTIWLECGRK